MWINLTFFFKIKQIVKQKRKKLSRVWMKRASQKNSQHTQNKINGDISWFETKTESFAKCLCVNTSTILLQLRRTDVRCLADTIHVLYCPMSNTQTNDVRFDNNLQLDSSNRSIAVPVRLSFDFEDFCCNDILVKWIKVCDSSTWYYLHCMRIAFSKRMNQ